MNNFVAYFYDITIDKLTFNNKYYSFNYLGYLYRLYLIDNIDVDMLVNINKRLIDNTLVSEIIINRDGKYISTYNGSNYILIKIYANPEKKISLDEITYLANTLYTKNIKMNWAKLWSTKIDYLENLINENGKKYPLLVDSFNYFVGLAENAISYYNSIEIGNDNTYVISHKTLKYNDTVDVLYNPLNIIFDYSVRDVAEYIKNSFWNNNKNIYDELSEYMKYNHLSITDVKLLISRILYPSFYFGLYEDILIYNMNESIILKFTNKLPQYEIYISNMIAFFNNYYDIPKINWLNRKNED